MHYKGREGPVEPATVVKVEAPLNGRVCGWACLGSYDPALVSEAPVGLIKRTAPKKVGVSEHHPHFVHISLAFLIVAGLHCVTARPEKGGGDIWVC